jgi:tRNA (mo5U34)-methyltransferase
VSISQLFGKSSDGGEGLLPPPAEVDFWFHSIDLGGGRVTPGLKSASVMAAELDHMRWPDVRGRTVLDIGAWDGYFSFAAERRGAARVVALDHFVWSLDLRVWALDRQKQQAFLRSLKRADGSTYDLSHIRYDEVPEVWHPDTLPGKKGFDHARRALGSRVESIVADFMTCDLEKVGRFDVALFLGVLYHLRNPLVGLERLRAVTNEVAVVETDAIATPGDEHRAMWEFYEGDQCNGDVTNWWAPNAKGMADACLAAGFARAEIVVGPPSGSKRGGHYRGVVHAYTR